MFCQLMKGGDFNIELLYEAGYKEHSILNIRYESAETLENMCKKNCISGFMGVDSSSVKHLRKDRFKLINHCLVYTPAFYTPIISKDNSAQIYISKSIVSQDNSFVLGGREYAFSETNRLQIAQQDSNQAMYLNGSFGLYIGSSRVISEIKKAYVKTLSCSDGLILHLLWKDTETEIQSQTPKRYSLEAFRKTIEQVSGMVMPRERKVVLPLSATVRKEIKK